MTGEEITKIIAGTVITGGLGLMFFFVRSYFNNLTEAIKNNTTGFNSFGKKVVKLEAKLDAQGRDIARIEGSLHTSERSLLKATENIYQARMELKALWRVAEKGNGSEKRLSDA